MKLIIRTPILILTLFALVFAGCDADPDYAAYETWDADQDEMLSQDEFLNTYRDAGYYEGWDTDGDGFVEVAEWETGVSSYYPVYDYDAYGDFSAWDINQDEVLDEDEFLTGTYTLWDTDQDGNIEAVEYNEWYHDI